ncbi:CrcB family protein [Natrialbaceae archaeon A-CW2]|uniref:CrcB family protein n=1 Tax=Natronosalvus amylolyticus TaxID=2961994 RepID=UPI0020C9C823|nr:CrcB family protein [Natronosalvus amylolyticus]
MSTDTVLGRLEMLALIGIGGFAGSNLRYFTLGVLPEEVALLVVNVLGSTVLGFLVYEAQYTGLVDRKSRLVFTTGFLSSLTTYSGFAFQTATAGGPLALGGIVVGNYALGFVGVLVGRQIARVTRKRGDRS